MSDNNNLLPNEHRPDQHSGEVNNLFPVFLKLEQLSVLIVGAGYVGHEKITAVLNNSPSAKVKLVGISISNEIKEFVKNYTVELIERAYESSDIDNADIVIAALNDPAVSQQVAIDAHAKGKLVNVADQPALCDFYLSSIVQKGNLKIAISTNGKSPTIAKRIKEVLNDTIPSEIDELLNNMHSIRNKMSGDFAEKVKQLNALTKKLSE